MTKRPCAGTNKNGKPCKASPLKGKTLCRRHDTSDASPARDEAWSRERFLEAFEETLMVSEACRKLGIHRSTAYAERQRNEEFAVAWHDVEERVTERLEAEAYRRAHDGVVKPVVSAGKHVTDERVFSDSLLQFLLKGRRPERYRERMDVQHGGSVEQHVRVDLSKLTDEQIAQLEEIATRLDA
jgi:hypothetical protein